MHRWIPTLKPGQKGSQPKLLFSLDFTPLLMVLAQGSSSQTGPDGGYSRPHGAGRVQNSATTVRHGFTKGKKKGVWGTTPSWTAWNRVQVSSLVFHLFLFNAFIIVLIKLFYGKIPHYIIGVILLVRTQCCKHSMRKNGTMFCVKVLIHQAHLCHTFKKRYLS